MPRTNAARARDQAARRKQILMSIGRRLNDVYQVTQPLPDRFSALVKKIEGSTCKSETMRPRRS